MDGWMDGWTDILGDRFIFRPFIFQEPFLQFCKEEVSLIALKYQINTRRDLVVKYLGKSNSFSTGPLQESQQ